MENSNQSPELVLRNSAIRIILPIIGMLSIIASPGAKAVEHAQLDCLVKPEMYIELSSPVDSVVEKMFVDIGEYIKKGQPLVQLEASVDRAKVELAKMQADSISEILNRRVQLKYAKLSNKRLKDLYAKNSVSQFEKDKTDTELALAEIELGKANEKRKLARLNLDLARTQLALKTIRSPIDGIVVDRYAMVGESVTERTIMKLAQINPLKVELIAPTEYFGLITKGMEVEVRTERPVNKIFIATVSIVDQLIDPASGSFTVRMALPNPDDELIGGVNCTASFDFETPEVTTQSTYSSL